MLSTYNLFEAFDIPGTLGATAAVNVAPAIAAKIATKGMPEGEKKEKVEQAAHGMLPFAGGVAAGIAAHKHLRDDDDSNVVRAIKAAAGAGAGSLAAGLALAARKRKQLAEKKAYA